MKNNWRQFLSLPSTWRWLLWSEDCSNFSSLFGKKYQSVLNQNKNGGFKRASPQVQSEANGKVFQCEICSKRFESKNILNVHMLIHLKNKCKKCDVNFETKQKFEEHQRKDHVNEIVDQP